MFKKLDLMAHPVLALPRVAKRLVALAVDASLCVLTVWLAFYLRVGEFVPLLGDERWQPMRAVVASLVFALPLFVVFGFYRAIFRYSGWPALMTVLKATVIYGLLFAAVFTAIGMPGVPRTVGLIQPVLLLLAVGASRAFARYWLGGLYQSQVRRESLPGVLIYGAGSAGLQLAAAMVNSLEMRVAGFLDDDVRLHGHVLQGLTIYSPDDLPGLVESLKVGNVLLAMPSLNRKRRNDNRMSGLVHSLTKREIYRHALEMQREGRMHDLAYPDLDDVFAGSVDRFAEIAFRLRGCHKVLDVGSGHGMLLSLLSDLGHECHGVDFIDQAERYPGVYGSKAIQFQVCNAEVDPLPFADDCFDAITCCQVLEHFTHSHLPLMQEIWRVLRPGGIAEVDVPNAVSFRNRSRILRGKHITYDYEEHYLYAEPVLHKGRSFYPVRHNREFTRDELRLLLERAGFGQIEVRFLKSRHHHEGFGRLRAIGTAVRDAVPSMRKSLIAFAEK